MQCSAKLSSPRNARGPLGGLCAEASQQGDAGVRHSTRALTLIPAMASA
jgi:hypothetical protein